MRSQCLKFSSIAALRSNHAAKRLIGPPAAVLVVILVVITVLLAPPARAEDPPPVPRGADEISRAQAFVDARYTAADVRHSFRTKFGEMIDCIDFFSQPGVKALAARGTPITKLPAPARRPQLSGPLAFASAAFDGSLDEDGNVRFCSDSTVPEVRLTVQDIESTGGIDAFLSRIKNVKKFHFDPSRARGGTPPETGDPAYAHTYTSYTGNLSIAADRATLSVWDPTVTTIPNHSLEQTWTTNDGTSSAPCAPDCTQTVEVGWTVDPNLASLVNPKTPQLASPHLFIYSTADGYQSGCYDVNIPSPQTPCPVWIGAPGSPFAVGMTLASSSAPVDPPTASLNPPTAQVLTIQVTQCSDTNDCQDGWEIELGTEDGGIMTVLSELGYYASSNYSGTFQTVAAVFESGGEVYDGTDLNTSTNLDSWKVPMGNGNSAQLGYGRAANVHNYYVFGSNLSNPDTAFDDPQSTVPDNYNVWTLPSAGNFESAWSNFFYLGDVPPPGCFPVCPYGYMCEEEPGALMGVCVVNHRCQIGEHYCNGACVPGTGLCP
jgi:Neprosin